MDKKIINSTFLLIILSLTLIMVNLEGSLATTNEPEKIKIFLGPNKLPADGNGYDFVAVQLQDATGKPARATRYITIDLSSSKTNIGTVDTNILIPPGETYGTATFYTTSTAGSTVISAASTGFSTVTATMTTAIIGSFPIKLSAYSIPQTFPADNQDYRALVVQLQDAQGRPTKADKDLYVQLYSSEPTVAQTIPLIMIPTGKTQAIGNLSITDSPGTASITAQASNFTITQTKLTTYLVDLSVLKPTLSANSTEIVFGGKSEITTYITANGKAITGATLKFTSDNGGAFTSIKEKGNGYYTSIFTAPSLSKNTTCTITGTVTKSEYISSSGSLKINVNSNPKQAITNSSLTLCIKDLIGKSISQVMITSTSVPANMPTLATLSNETGYVSFHNLQPGQYSFSITKEGFQPLNQTLTIKNQQLSLSIMLTEDATSINYLLAIIVVIITVAVIAACWFLLRKRSKSNRIKKLKELQKKVDGLNKGVL